MNLTLKHGWVLALTMLVAYASYTFGTCGITRTCEEYALLNPYAITLFEPLFYFSLATIPLSIALLFANDTAFRALLRFARWWLPLTILVVWMAPAHGGGWMPLYPELTKDSLALIMGGIATVVGLRMMMRARKRVIGAVTYRRKRERD